MIQNYRFGIDLDGTLFDSPSFKLSSGGLEELVEKSRYFPVKKGIEILSELELDVTIITGRGESFRKVTVECLVEYNIAFRELVMIDDYLFDKFDKDLYLKHKLDSYLSKGIHFALDDDIEVINLLNKYNINAVKVDKDFREAFDKLFLR